MVKGGTFSLPLNRGAKNEKRDVIHISKLHCQSNNLNQPLNTLLPILRYISLTVKTLISIQRPKPVEFCGR